MSRVIRAMKQAGIRSDSEHERGYAPKGKTPVVRLNVKRASVNMISAITNQGKVRFHAYEETMNADKLIEFLKRLIRSSKQNVFFDFRQFKGASRLCCTRLNIET